MKTQTTLYMGKWKIPDHAAQDAYATHQALWEGFEDKTEQNERKFLYMTTRNGEAISISREKPLDHKNLLAVKTISPEFETGRKYRFVTCANPCRQVSSTGKREGIMTDQGIMDWLQSKLEGTAKIVSGHVKRKEFRVGRKKGMKFWVADIEGVMECVDPEALVSLLETGYGRARGMGCGIIIPYAVVE